MKKLTGIRNIYFKTTCLSLWMGLLSVSGLAFAGPEQDALMTAIAASDSNAIIAMLDTPEMYSKINFNENDAAGWNPLSLASAMGNVEIVRRLLQEEDVHLDAGVMSGGQHVSPVILAAMHGKHEVVAEILNSPRFGREEYLTAIKLAMNFGQHALADQFLTARANKFPMIGNQSNVACARAQSHFPTDQLALAVTGLFEDHCPSCYDSIGINPDSEDRPRILRTIDDRAMSGPIAITQCGHCFCGNCLNTWRTSRAAGSQGCPICRKPLNTHTHIFAWNDQGLANWTGPKVP